VTVCPLAAGGAAGDGFGEGVFCWQAVTARMSTIAIEIIKATLDLVAIVPPFYGVCGCHVYGPDYRKV
jgi:hypothetical protein